MATYLGDLEYHWLIGQCHDEPKKYFLSVFHQQ